MRRATLAILAWLVLEASALGATLTIDNLWPYAGYRLTSLTLVADGQAIVSTTPIDPLEALVLSLPSSLDAGFRFGGLGVGGVCPNNCGWYSGFATVWAGAWIAPGMAIDVLWPAIGGGLAPIARVRYDVPPVPVATAVTTVPDGGSAGLLLAIGVALIGLARWRT